MVLTSTRRFNSLAARFARGSNAPERFVATTHRTRR
jgi:hypothetical protein